MRLYHRWQLNGDCTIKRYRVADHICYNYYLHTEEDEDEYYYKYGITQFNHTATWIHPNQFIDVINGYFINTLKVGNTQPAFFDCQKISDYFILGLLKFNKNSSSFDRRTLRVRPIKARMVNKLGSIASAKRMLQYRAFWENEGDV